MELDLIFQKRNYGRPMRVVCTGAHPDDPETGCGGTLSRLLAAGHKVAIVYLTRGEAGVKYIPKAAVTWNPCEEKAAVAGVRSAEARRACGIRSIVRAHSQLMRHVPSLHRRTAYRSPSLLAN
jgi:LmbE family N-acetylglucosaminyl deacetylase